TVAALYERRPSSSLDGACGHLSRLRAVALALRGPPIQLETSFDLFLGHFVPSIYPDRVRILIRLRGFRGTNDGIRRRNRSDGRRLRLARFLDSEISRCNGIGKFVDLIIQTISQHELNASALLGQYHLLRLFLCDQQRRDSGARCITRL